MEDMDKTFPSVVIVGAGVSGLTAAAILHKTGKFQVTLLEAAARIGGRTYTHHLPNGRHIEMGAEWIHGEESNSVFDLIQTLGIVRHVDPSLGPNQYLLPSGEALNGTVVERIEKLKEVIEKDPEGLGAGFRKGSQGQYASKMLDIFQEVQGEEDRLPSSPRLLGAVLDWLHRITCLVDGAVNWFEDSANRNGEQYKELDGAEVVWKPPYAYSSLHQFILTGNVTEDGAYNLPDWIHLGKEVVSIDYHNINRASQVKVGLLDGTCLTVDHVIFTPSLGVLKAKHNTLFCPPLSAKKQLTIASLGFGVSTKYFLEFEKRWWPPNYNFAYPLWDDIDYDNGDPCWMYWRSNITKKELMADLNGFPLWTRSMSVISTIDSGAHPNMLRIMFTGPSCKYLESMDPSYVQLHVMQVIRRFLANQFPAGVPDPINAYQSKWQGDPFSRGVYSYRTPEADRQNVWAQDLAEPILDSKGKPVVCFAGEATHPIFFSTVHGAYETGLREARRVEAWHCETGDNGK